MYKGVNLFKFKTKSYFWSTTEMQLISGSQTEQEMTRQNGTQTIFTG